MKMTLKRKLVVMKTMSRMPKEALPRTRQTSKRPKKTSRPSKQKSSKVPSRSKLRLPSTTKNMKEKHKCTNHVDGSSHDVETNQNALEEFP